MVSLDEQEVIRLLIHKKLDGQENTTLKKTVVKFGMDSQKTTELIKKADSIYLKIVKLQASKSKAQEHMVYGLVAFVIGVILSVLIMFGLIPFSILDSLVLVPLFGGFYVAQNNYSMFLDMKKHINELQN